MLLGRTACEFPQVGILFVAYCDFLKHCRRILALFLYFRPPVPPFCPVTTPRLPSYPGVSVAEGAGNIVNGVDVVISLNAYAYDIYPFKNKLHLPLILIINLGENINANKL